jgi:flagellar protein FlgJ
MTSKLPSDGLSIKDFSASTAASTGQSLTAAARRNAEDREQARLQQACADFEALLIQKLFQTMRAAIPKSGLIDSGPAEDIYNSMLDQQVAQDLALQGGLGLSTQIKAQIVRYMQNAENPHD